MATATKPRPRRPAPQVSHEVIDLPAGEMDLRDDDVAPPSKTVSREKPGPIFAAPVRRLCRHPDNRVPTAADVDAMAASLQADRQLEPLLVRAFPAGDTEWQILSGETRWLAAQRLGWDSIDCREVIADSARALELVAIANGQRHDLNPMQRAHLIERLCHDRQAGGAGLTREQAAQHVGLQSASAASNLVRLLKLPAKWQDRVADGELPESFARLLVPACHLSGVIAELEQEWKRDAEELLSSRDDFEREVIRAVDKKTRPITKGLNWSGQLGNTYVNEECKIHPDDISANRLKLGITTVSRECFWPHERQGLPDAIEVCTNVKLWEQLQTKALAAKETKKAAKAGRDKPAPQRELSAQEQKANAAQRAKQLRQRIDAWRHDWIRGLVAERLPGKEFGLTAGQRLLAWLVTAPLNDYRHLVIKVEDQKWERVRNLGPDDCSDRLIGLLTRILTAPDKDTRRPLLEHAIVLDLAQACEIDLEQEWERLQIVAGGPERFERFLLLHDSAGLRAQMKEWKRNAPENATKALLVKLVHAAAGDLSLPSSLAIAVKRKSGKKPAREGAKNAKGK